VNDLKDKSIRDRSVGLVLHVSKGSPQVTSTAMKVFYANCSDISPHRIWYVSFYASSSYYILYVIVLEFGLYADVRKKNALGSHLFCGCAILWMASLPAMSLCAN
jgi:hypothetical protein